MTINAYTQPTANTIKIDLTNIQTPGNVDLITTTNNSYGTPYISASQQGTYGGSVFNAYLCFSTAVSLVVKRYVLSLAYTSIETFPAEVAGCPAWKSFYAAPFDQIQLRTSGATLIQKLCIMESKPVG